MRTAAAVALSLALAAGLACGPARFVDIRVDMPGVSPFPAGSFDEVAVADFREEAPVDGLAAGRALADYLAREIDLAFKGTVTRVAAPEEALAARGGRVLVVSGEVRLATEVRKALDKRDLPVDGPFKAAERGVLERRRWTMTVDLAIRSAADGTTLYRREYREDRDYTDLEKPADFALSELSARVRARLLPVLLGTTTIETRTLIAR